MASDGGGIAQLLRRGTRPPGQNRRCQISFTVSFAKSSLCSLGGRRRWRGTRQGALAAPQNHSARFAGQIFPHYERKHPSARCRRGVWRAACSRSASLPASCFVSGMNFKRLLDAYSRLNGGFSIQRVHKRPGRLAHVQRGADGCGRKKPGGTNG